MSDKLTTAYRRLTDRLPRRRPLEAWSHLMSWLAVTLTALMVGTAQALETNPVSSALIETLGMRGFAVAATVGVALAFRLVEQFDSWRSHRAIGSLLAMALTLDAGGNAAGVARSGLPETLLLEDLIVTASVTALIAIALFARIDRRAIYIENKRRVGKSLFAALLVVASLSGGFMPSNYQPVQSANGSGTVIEDFESGDFSNWDGTINNLVISQERTFEGDYSAKISVSDNTLPDDLTTSSRVSPSSFSFRMWVSESCTDSTEYGSVNLWDSGASGNLATLQIETGSCILEDDGQQKVSDLKTGQWNIIRVTNIDYSADTYDVSVENPDGTVIGSMQDVPFANAVEGFDTVRMSLESPLDGSYIDFFGYNGITAKTESQNVSGDNGITAKTESQNVPGDMKFTVDDYTDDLAYQSPDELTVFRPDGTSATATFSDGTATLSGFNCSKRYTLLLRDGGAYWEAQDVAVPCVSDTVTLIPGFDSGDTLGETPTPTTDTATDSEINEIETRFERIERDYNETEEPRYELVFDPPQPTDDIEWNITGPNGTEYYNGSFDTDGSSDYYRVELPENATGGVDNPQLNYEGQFATGEGFNGSIDLSGDGAIFGPVGGSSSSSDGDPTLGLALVGGVAYLGYRRFGDGQIGQAASAAASAVSRRLGP